MAYVYINNWQSIDFRESMNALLTREYWDQEADFLASYCYLWGLIPLLRLDLSLGNGGKRTLETFSLGQEEQVVQNQYSNKDFWALW